MYIKHFVLTFIFFGFWISSTEIDAAPPLNCADLKDPTGYCEKQCTLKHGITFPLACCIKTFLSGFAPTSTCVCCFGDTCHVPYAQTLVCIDGDAPICGCLASADKMDTLLSDKCRASANKCSRYYRE